MIILAIESSCDETAAAIVKNGSEVLANVVSSQVPIHKKFGGVVPELASRAHLEGVLPIIDLALERANIQLADITALAVTKGPGLIGALMVGVQTAKSIAYALNKPLVGVNHIEAHITAIRLTDERTPEAPTVPFPHAALAVSGGHTAIYRVNAPGDIEQLGQTLDDAAGEAFDKVATLLGLGYPGGRVIDDLAKTGNPKAIDFPRAWLSGRRNYFSFSGLKTSVKNHVAKNGVPSGQALSDLCASFQEAVVHVLVKKTLRAAKAAGVRDVVIAGGVAANSRLRSEFLKQGEKERCKVHLTQVRYCSDNAAMIAALGYDHIMRDEGQNFLAMDATANLRCGQ